ncbi:hypothetical protein BDV40DRAFT_266680 [Aspergillus tamarii]|uniref:Uncharacterized protein n=1 Tax=Aspergillus tamarii TaxID=41984 RepID=A0A5N6UT01_ASPTM|nr:hypothetical protein BDV40DRAFT_266680 [Aspergillus tamarii]
MSIRHESVVSNPDLPTQGHWIGIRNRAPGGLDQQKHRHLSVVAPTAEWRSQRNCSFATTADKQWCWWRRDTGDKAGRTTRPTAISIAKDH